MGHHHHCHLGDRFRARKVSFLHLTCVVSVLIPSVIPSMGDFLSIMSAAFDSFFGFIFWALAYYHLNRGRFFSTPFKSAQSIAMIIIMALGFFMLGPGMYTSVKAIVLD